MKLDIAEAWATRLESGLDRQGNGFLRKRYGGLEEYCCLGVLCEMAVGAGIIPPPREDEPDSPSSEYWYDGDVSGELPKKVQEWAGMSSNDGDLNQLSSSDTDKLMHNLVEMNDEDKLTFPEIAAVIREHYQRL